MEFAHYPSLEKKVVLITGGANGIGANFVEQFTKQGSQVAFIDIDDEAAETLSNKLMQEDYARPLYIHCDLVDTEALKKAIQHAFDVLGNIHVLVNNASNDLPHSTVAVNEDLWNEFININLRQHFFCAQSVIPMMIKNGGGSIINVGSNCFLLPQFPIRPCYTIAKSAIVGLTRSLANEFGEKNIRVNCLLPGLVATKRSLKTQTHNEKTPTYLHPEELSRLALFLAADDSKMITKQCLIIDGGHI